MNVFVAKDQSELLILSKIISYQFCLVAGYVFERKLLLNLSQAPSIFFRENRYDTKEENEQFNDFENGT